MSELQKLAELLREKVHRVNLSSCDETEAEFQSKFMYCQALTDIADCIGAALEGKE